MLRQFQHVVSKLHNLQSFVNHVMLDVLTRAPYLPDASFHTGLVLEKYRNLITNTNHDYLLNPLTEIYSICRVLSRNSLKTIRKAVHNNNKIRELCNGVVEPVTYEVLNRIHPGLQKPIKTLCDALYDKCLKLVGFIDQFGDIKQYYKQISRKSSVCKCCGVNKILTQFHAHRSALDHYLTRAIYPFNSVNFNNLLPVCDTCNSKYKLAKDVLSYTTDLGLPAEKENKTVAFYPFSRTAHDIEITIELLQPYSSLHYS